MDWSLVLASQGIESTIQRCPERERWILQIAPDHLARAQDSIRLYRAENRGWSWRKELPGVDIELHWGAIVFCLVLVVIHSFTAYQFPMLADRGQLDSAKVLQSNHPEWWRIFTAIFLHRDLAHLMSNVTFGFIVLGLSMGRFGAGATLLATLLAGAVGNLFGLYFRAHAYFGLGASGMMMGALGVLAVHSVSLWRANPKAARYIFGGVGAGFLIFILFGVSPDSDVLAHVGGFIGGLFFGGLLALLPNKFLRHPATNPTALFFFVTFSALVWTLALR